MSDAIKNKLSEQKDVIQKIDDLPKFKNLVNNYRSDLSSVL
jgi:hypothetical protein